MELNRFSESRCSIVAVHGLNGHRESTWTDDNNVLWLRDLLPSKLLNARVWTWGYDSRTHTKSHHDHLTIKKLYDHARELVHDLDGERRDDSSYQRPIIFIAHGLGGIVVKSVSFLFLDAAYIQILQLRTTVNTSVGAA